MKKIIISLLLLVCFNAFGKNKYEGTFPLVKYEVVNPNIFLVLDSIIDLKDKMPFYKSTGLFTIEFNQDSVLTDLIFVRAQGNQMHFYYSNMLEYFNYRNHTFVISGNSINTSVFKKTGKYRNFVFGPLPTQYTDKGEPIIRTYRQFAVWSMRYKDGHFKILSFFTHDQKDPWFDHIEEEYKIENYPSEIEISLE